MRILFDTDVTLDLLLDRKPYSENAALLFSKAERGEFDGYICATTVTTIHYLASRAIGEKKAMNSLRKLISFLDVAAIDRKVIEGAMGGKGRDFEDKVISQAASSVGAKVIITRNVKDFKDSDVPAYAPGEFLNMLRAGDLKQ